MGKAIEERIDRRIAAEQGETFDGPITRDFIPIVNVVQELREDQFLFDAAIAELAEMPQRERAIVGFVVKLLHQTRDAVGILVEVAGDEIHFDRRAADAHVVGIQRGVHKIVEMIGVVKLAAPERKLLIDGLERLEVSRDGAFEKLLGLRLRREAADGFEGQGLGRRCGNSVRG